jgi:SAM-dependent methyltransferase
MAQVYDRIGVGYSDLRSPDPRLMAAISAALGDARSVVNVGAGTGSYEPGSDVVAVEPSAVMLSQRPAGAAAAVQAVAEALPFGDQAFDAALAVLTTHHWADPLRGLDEMARVSRRQVVFTWDQSVVADYWLLADYVPDVVAMEAPLAALSTVAARWPSARVLPVPIPADCTDGFLAAYWRRPEAYLRQPVRSAISSFSRLAPALVEDVLARLTADLESGAWYERHGHLLELDELDLGYRLVVNG